MTKVMIKGKEIEVHELTVEQLFDLEDFFPQVNFEKKKTILANVKANYALFKKALSHVYGEEAGFFDNLPGGELASLVNALVMENQALIKNSMSTLENFGNLMNSLGIQVQKTEETKETGAQS